MEFSPISFLNKYAKCSKCKLNFLVDNIIEFSKKDMTVQRFQGLGGDERRSIMGYYIEP
nr:hypothetical protein [Ehrlichia ruminantium]